MFLIYIIGLSTLCTINNSVLWWAGRKCFFFFCKYLLFTKHNIQLFGHQYVQQIFLCLLSQRIYSNNASYHIENSIYITYSIQYSIQYMYKYVCFYKDTLNYYACFSSCNGHKRPFTWEGLENGLDSISYYLRVNTIGFVGVKHTHILRR